MNGAGAGGGVARGYRGVATDVNENKGTSPSFSGLLVPYGAIRRRRRTGGRKETKETGRDARTTRRISGRAEETERGGAEQGNSKTQRDFSIVYLSELPTADAPL